jgi:hypothetical protein
VAGKGLEGGGDLEVGAAGDGAGVEGVVGQLDQGVGVALLLAAVVVVAVAAGQRSERLLERGRAFAVDGALEPNA